MSIQEFLKNPKYLNKWIDCGHLRVYVRRQMLWLGRPPKPSPHLAIANVQCEHPGQGSYTNFLEFLFQNLPDEFNGIYVENCTKRFQEYHLFRGWEKYAPPGDFGRHVHIQRKNFPQ